MHATREDSDDVVARVTAAQPLRPVLVTLGLVAVLLLSWFAAVAA